MNIISYQRPWGHTFPAGHLEQLFDHFLGDAPAAPSTDGQWTPPVDIREEDTRFVIEADIPGVDPASIEVHTDKGVLSVRGERSAVDETDVSSYTRTERQQGSFHRRFTLPESVDPERISASGRLGVLTIDIPKREPTTPRRIDIKTIV